MGTIEKINAILEDIYEGLSVRNACEKHGLSRPAFYENLMKNPSLANLYAGAMEANGQDLADEMKDIADNPEIDPARARNMLDTRKWLASKRHPRVYGDRIDLNVTQTVDIGAALAEAKARAALPMCYPGQTIEVQHIKTIEQKPIRTAGQSTGDESQVLERRDADENASDDIFD